MKKVIFITLFLICSQMIFATEQMPDYLLYKGRKLILSTGWGHPSPLQTYFQQNDLKYPFQIWSTANYRGHVATWEIENNKFILHEIKVRNEIVNPSRYDIKSKSDTIIKDGGIWADWFTGVLSCSMEKGSDSYFFYIRNGVVVENQIITEKDYKKIQNISEKDTANHELMRKYSMLILNQNYISYYFRLSSEDQIFYNGVNGRFVSKQGYSPILGLFKNDHTQWLYNWENFEKTGAPCCKWVVNNDKVYLTEIGLNTGTSFFEVSKSNVPLMELFTDATENNQIYADWLTGVYIIQYGEEKEDPLLTGFKEFKIDSIAYIRIIGGLITEKYTVSKDYMKNGIPNDADEGLKKILGELDEL